MSEHDMPCPHCHGVHYSTFNSERCVMRYQLDKEAADWQIEVSRKNDKAKVRKKPKYASRDEELAAWILKRDSRVVKAR
jgi:hypothetical protein